MNKEAMAHWGEGGLTRHKQTNNIVVRVINILALSSEKYWYIYNK
jgi:hypothetical protein